MAEDNTVRSSGPDRGSFRTLIAGDARMTLAALAGGALCAATGLPAAWLTGAMVTAALLCTALKWKPLSRHAIDSSLLLSGILLGSSATPETLSSMSRYPLSLVIMVLTILLIVLVVSFYLVRVNRWPGNEAVLASVPGALTTVMAVALSQNVGLSRIAVVQLLRLFLLVAALPLVVTMSGIAPAISLSTSDVMTPQSFAAVAAAALGAGALFQKLRITTPLILGATAASLTLHGLGVVKGVVPAPIAVLAFVLLGAGIGGRLINLTPQDTRALLPSALVAFGLSMAIALVLAWPAAQLAAVPFVTALVAFAPGGLEAMAMLAFALGLDPLYVGAHHLLRFLVVAFGIVPLLAVITRWRLLV